MFKKSPKTFIVFQISLMTIMCVLNFIPPLVLSRILPAEQSSSKAKLKEGYMYLIIRKQTSPSNLNSSWNQLLNTLRLKEFHSNMFLVCFPFAPIFSKTFITTSTQLSSYSPSNPWHNKLSHPFAQIVSLIVNKCNLFHLNKKSYITCFAYYIWVKFISFHFPFQPLHI